MRWKGAIAKNCHPDLFVGKPIWLGGLLIKKEGEPERRDIIDEEEGLAGTQPKKD